MGLDMYIYKYPRVGLEPRSIDAVDHFASWIKDGLEYSFEDWCGYTMDDLPDMEMTMKLLRMKHVSHPAWDESMSFPVDDINEIVGYWRKANSIHKWFVDNVQDGVDDCEFHRPVTKDDLETLFELCREILADHNKADELLPNQSGFFFGSQEYDKWYFNDIEKTAELCKRLIDETDFEKFDLYYCSSW